MRENSGLRSSVKPMNRVLVIGGGPAGMMAAISAAEAGCEVTLFEKNEKLGKKLYLTGKGRCNLTNEADISDFFAEVARNPKFLYSAFYGFDNRAVQDFFSEKCRVPLKTERGGRIFPVSDHSSDIIRALERELTRLGVAIRLHSPVSLIERDAGGFRIVTGKETVFGETIVLATGGCSYPTTGSDGTAFALAESLGHTVTRLFPSLVPIVTAERFPERLAGLTLKNVTLSVYDDKKELCSEFGELLFTHTGISGPIALKCSCKAAPALTEGKTLSMTLDLKSALSEEKLTERILREIEATPNQELKSLMPRLLPKSLGEVLLELAGLPGETRLHSLTKEMRCTLIRCLKAFPMTAKGTAGFKEAIITNGGIPVKEINPATMESKVVPGLFFAGEMIDCDAHTGGYNLQIAWSTGHLAGESCSGK